MKIYRNLRQKSKNQGRLKNFSDGLCIMALSVFKKKYDGYSGNSAKTLQQQIF